MAEIKISNSGNWLMELANAIENSKDGDLIVVSNEAAKELAERAKARMCPMRNVRFDVQEVADPFA